MKRILHITSTEDYLVENKINEIKKEMNIDIDNDLNFLNTKSLENLSDFATTFTFFDTDDKLAIIQGVSEDALIDVIELIPDNMTLIIKGTLDKRKKLYKYLKKNKYILEIKQFNKRDLCNWIVEECEKLNTTISPALALKIIERTGDVDMYNIHSQLVKLAYMREIITEDLIKKVVTKSLLVKSFDLTNTILRKDINKSFEILNELISNSEEMIPLLFLINKNFCIIKSLHEVHEDDLKELGINPFVIKNLRQFKNSFSIKKLESYISLCQELDYDLKNGYDPKLVMERLILNI